MFSYNYVNLHKKVLPNYVRSFLVHSVYTYTEWTRRFCAPVQGVYRTVLEVEKSHTQNSLGGRRDLSHVASSRSNSVLSAYIHALQIPS